MSSANESSNDELISVSSHPIVRNIANILMSFDNVVTLKEWMSNGHAKTRDTMQQCIAHLIGQRREYATEEWMAKLSEVAKRVELRLYSSAESYEEYNDPNTLAERLQNLVQILVVEAANVKSTNDAESMYGRHTLDNHETNNLGMILQENHSSHSTPVSYGYHSDDICMNKLTSDDSGNFLPASYDTASASDSFHSDSMQHQKEHHQTEQQILLRQQQQQQQQQQLLLPNYPMQILQWDPMSNNFTPIFGNSQGHQISLPPQQPISNMTSLNSENEKLSSTFRSGLPGTTGITGSDPSDPQDLTINGSISEDDQTMPMSPDGSMPSQTAALSNMFTQSSMYGETAQVYPGFSGGSYGLSGGFLAQSNSSGKSALGTSQFSFLQFPPNGFHQILADPNSLVSDQSGNTNQHSSAGSSNFSLAMSSQIPFPIGSILNSSSSISSTQISPGDDDGRGRMDSNTNNVHQNMMTQFGGISVVPGFPNGVPILIQPSQLLGNQNIGISRQVSSQGCSRVFIVKVLVSVSDFVRGKILPSIFTFKRELVMHWLKTAKDKCCSPDYEKEERFYGGPPFVFDDASTHWTEPHQLYTWWKNNVERRSKFKVLHEDAQYCGKDQRKLARARWCETVVALSEVIRNSSGSSACARLNNQVNRSKDFPKNSFSGNSSSSISSFSMNGMSLGSGAHPEPTDNRISLSNKSSSSAFSKNSICASNSGSGSGSFPKEENGKAESSKRRLDVSSVSARNKFIVDSLSSGALPQGLTDVQSFDSTGYDHHKLNSALNYIILNQGIGSRGNVSEFAVPSQFLDASMQRRFNSLTRDEKGDDRVFGSRSDQKTTYVGMSSMGGVHPAATFDSLIDPLLNPTNSGVYQALYNQKNFASTFPLKLFDLVTTEDPNIVGWHESGREFQVRNMDLFVSIILPKHFKHQNFTSFQRQLNLYGFRRSRDSDKGAYYHPQFIKGDRDLCATIRRLLTSGSDNTGDADFMNPHSRKGAQEEYPVSRLVPSYAMNSHEFVISHIDRRNSDSGANKRKEYRGLGKRNRDDDTGHDTDEEDNGKNSVNTEQDDYTDPFIYEGIPRKTTKRSIDAAAAKLMQQTRREKERALATANKVKKKNDGQSIMDDMDIDSKGHITIKALPITRAKMGEPSTSMLNANTGLHRQAYACSITDYVDGSDNCAPGLNFSFKGCFNKLAASGEYECLVDLAFVNAKCIAIDMSQSSDGFVYGSTGIGNSYTGYGSLAKGVSMAQRSRNSTAQEDDIKVNRIGDEFQADVPDVSNPPWISEEKGAVVDANYISSVRSDCLVWDSSRLENSVLNSFMNDYMEKISFIERQRRLTVGLVLVVNLPTLRTHRLCTITQIHGNTNDTSSFDDVILEKDDELMLSVYDGEKEWVVPSTYCCLSSDSMQVCISDIIHCRGYKFPGKNEQMSVFEDMLKIEKLNKYRYSKLLSTDEVDADEKENVEKPWTYEEVNIFCDGIRRFGDNLRRVASLLSDTRTLVDVIDFFHHIHPHCQRGGTGRVKSIYKRSDYVIRKSLYPDASSESDSDRDDDDDEYDSVEFEGSVDGESRNSEELNIAADIRCISNSPINSYDSVLSTRQTRASRAPHVALDSMPSVDSHSAGNKDKNEIVPEIKKKRDEKEVLEEVLGSAERLD